MTKHKTKFDEIGPWSEVKLEIIRKYAAAYTAILSKKKFKFFYIDGFAGAGTHVSKTTGELVPGSPLNALRVSPPFQHYYLIDSSGSRISSLEKQIGNREDVTLRRGDCNDVLLTEIFPLVRYEHYERALCLLDPYGLHLNWEVMRQAGQMRTIDLFLNFPTMDMNMNALHRRPGTAEREQIARMNAFWGDESWRDVAYRPASQEDLFGDPELQKVPMDEIANAFRTRLRKVAGFKHVPKPVPMRNSTNAIVYYLFFASHQPVADDIVTQIFSRYGR